MFPALLLALAALLTCSLPTAVTADSPPHVCLIGAGITSASAAHFLSLHPSPPTLTVFEKSPTIGGRIQTFHIPASPRPIPVEAGASIIASSNALMRYFVHFLSLSTATTPASSNRLGIWSGSRFLFRTCRRTLPNIALLLYRYGLAPLRMRRFVTRLLRHYHRVYPAAGVTAAWPPCRSMHCLLARSGPLYNLTQLPFSPLAVERFGPRFTNEFVAAVTRVNYGQLPHTMHALAGAIALAGSGDDLWAVRGGNVQVVQGLFARANATVHVKTRVEQVRNEKDGFKVTAQGGRSWACDAVVLGVSAELARVQLPAESRGLDVGRKFKTTVATFVQGGLNEGTFGSDAPEAVVCAGDAEEEDFRSIGRAWEGDGARQAPVWKVFSEERLSERTVERLFDGGVVVGEFVWKAYPEFRVPERWGDWEGGVVYGGGVEGGGGAMEMGAVGGANAAAVVMQQLGMGGNAMDANGKKDEL